MKRWALALAALTLCACAPKRSGEGAGPKVEGTSVSGFVSPHSVVVQSERLYFVSHRGSAGAGMVSEVRGTGDSRPLLAGLISPGGLSTDYRRAELYVVDGSRVKIFKWKKPEKPPVVIEVPTSGALFDVSYSLMNRRAYVSEPGANTIWEVDPKRKSAAVLLRPEVFAGLDRGAPRRLLASSDGSRLYVATSWGRDARAGAKTAVLSFRLRDRKATVLAEFGDLLTLSGIDVYNNQLVVTDEAAGEIRLLSLERGRAAPQRRRALGHPVALSMNLSRAVVLDRPMEGGVGVIREVSLRQE